MLPELLGISLCSNETLVARSRYPTSYVVHVPSAEVVSVTHLFSYPTQLVEATGMTIDKSNLVPLNFKLITMQVQTATGLSRSYEFTVVQKPGLSTDAPASPDPGGARCWGSARHAELPRQLTKQMACSALPGNVHTQSVVEIV